LSICKNLIAHGESWGLAARGCGEKPIFWDYPFVYNYSFQTPPGGKTSQFSMVKFRVT